MELNGLANIKVIISMAVEDDLMHSETALKIYAQLDTLERYMLAYADHCASKQAGAYGALIVKVEEPLWHEVKANPEQYPNGNQRIAGIKKQMGVE